MRRCLLAAAALCLFSSAWAEVTPHALFTDHACLQRGRQIPVWGSATTEQTVTVKLNGQSAVATVTAGQWLAWLPAMEAGGPFDLVITGENTVTVKDVVVGEVWLCSGQSNMQWALRNTVGSEAAIAASADPHLRLLTVPRRGADEPQTALNAAWTVSAPATTPDFSAVGYYFGQHLRQQLKVPVGLINTSYGGTPAEAWTSAEMLAGTPGLEGVGQRYQQALEQWPAAREKWQTATTEWQARRAAAQAEGKPFTERAPQVPMGPENVRRPSALYNAMIAPLLPYAIAGAIWYQGESNAGRGWEYRTLFPAMIQDWRNQWRQGDFPFLFVQLAPFQKIRTEPGPSPWAELREAQSLTLTALPRTGMAVITDVGEEDDIHPQQKQPVGERLAIAARAIAYGEAIEFSGPVFDKLTIEGSQARLHFSHTSGGLVAKDGPLTGFIIAGEDQRWHNATARIDGATVVVSSDQVPSPVAVRMGWDQYPVVNLWNGAGLPASPFRTDTWRINSQPAE